MGFIEALGAGAGNLFAWPNILIPVAGTLIAMTTSFLPGIGGTSIAVILVVMTAKWDPVSALLLFGALTGGATFMGSITSILFNIPGNASSTPALLDGYPMGQKGLTRTAIACAATASAVGSVFGVAVLIALLPVIRPWLLEFGPLEMVGLGVLGMTTILAVPSNAPLKVLAGCGLGLLAAMVGSDPSNGLPRWTFGFIGLYDGFATVPVLVGFFTISEIILWRRSFDVHAAAARRHPADSTREGVFAVFRNLGLTIRSSVIGTLVGIVPGVGGTVAGFVSYGLAVQTAKTGRENFGHGDIRGLIAPEAAVDAKDGGSLLPVLSFGLPGSEAGVVLLTVLAIHGLTPGVPMLSSQLDLTFTLILALLLSNILTSVVGVALTPYLARLTHLRIDRFVVPALVATFVSLVQLNGSLPDLYVAVGFGLLGYFFRRHEWPRVPFVIAFVLGDFIEKNTGLTLELMRLDRIALADRPVAIAIIALVLSSLAWMLWQRPRQGRQGRDTSAAAGFPLALFALVAVLAVAGFSGTAAYSNYLRLICLGTSLVLLFILREGLKGRSFANGGSYGPAIPRQHVSPLLSLALLPFAIEAFGLVASVAVLAGLWLMPVDGSPARNLFRIAAVAAAVGILTGFYIDRLGNLILPTPWLAGLLPLP